MKNKAEDLCYSMDGESYYDYCTVMDNLKEYHAVGDKVEIWEATSRRFKHVDFIIPRDIIDNIKERAYDECGEVAEDYLSEITKDQINDLESHVAEWFEKNTVNIKFYGVENEHKIEIVVE